jgi:hypothetical protein
MRKFHLMMQDGSYFTIWLFKVILSTVPKKYCDKHRKVRGILFCFISRETQYDLSSMKIAVQNCQIIQRIGKGEWYYWGLFSVGRYLCSLSLFLPSVSRVQLACPSRWELGGCMDPNKTTQKTHILYSSDAAYVPVFGGWVKHRDTLGTRVYL